MAVATITADEFHAQIESQPGLVVLDFFTPTCPPCKMIAPELDRLSNELDDVKFVKVDAQANIDLAVAFRVSAVPKLVLIRDGQPVAELTGYKSADHLRQWINDNRDRD